MGTPEPGSRAEDGSCSRLSRRCKARRRPRVDFGFDRFLAFDPEHLRQQEAERTGRVSLELRRAELVVAVENLRDALPVGLALEHSFVGGESRLLIPRLPSPRWPKRTAPGRRGPFGQQAKKRRFLLADFRCGDETQIGICQCSVARRDWVEVVRRGDAKGFRCEETAHGRDVRTRENRLTCGTYAGKTQSQTAACTRHDGIKEEHLVLLRRRGGRGSPGLSDVAALRLRVEAVIRTRAGKARFGQSCQEEVRNVEIADLCRLEEKNLADWVFGGGEILRLEYVLEPVRKLAQGQLATVT